VWRRRVERAALGRLTTVLDGNPEAAANLWQRVEAPEPAGDAARRRSC